MAQARDEWRASQSELNPERLVFIDETGAATDMARRYGRCPRGQRLVSSVPWDPDYVCRVTSDEGQVPLRLPPKASPRMSRHSKSPTKGPTE